MAARKAVEKKKDRITRKPRQKGKIKKAQSQRPPSAFFMRSELPPHMRPEREHTQPLDISASSVISRNVAAWRAAHNLA